MQLPPSFAAHSAPPHHPGLFLSWARCSQPTLPFICIPFLRHSHQGRLWTFGRQEWLQIPYLASATMSVGQVALSPRRSQEPTICVSPSQLPEPPALPKHPQPGVGTLSQAQLSTLYNPPSISLLPTHRPPSLSLESLLSASLSLLGLFPLPEMPFALGDQNSLILPSLIYRCVPTL